MTVTVTLLKGPDKLSSVWTHASRASAARRAEALAELHSTDWARIGDEFTVDASRFYTAKARRKARAAL